MDDNTKFKFIPNTSTQCSNGDCSLDIINYYQVATFADHNTNKYHLKKFVINENNQFIRLTEYRLTKRQMEKFLSKKKQNEYKLFSSYDLSGVNYPNNGDISLARSSILGEDSSYSGYAAF